MRCLAPMIIPQSCRNILEEILGSLAERLPCLKLRQHLGLGDAESVDELMIKWPRSGIVQKFPNVQGNRIVAITEGKDELIEKHYGKPVK